MPLRQTIAQTFPSKMFMESTKVCFRCSTEQPISNFYVHKQMADGHLGKCKTCTKSETEKKRQEIISTPEGLEKEQARHRNKYHRLGYKNIHKPTHEMKKRATGKYKQKYPEKIQAHSFSYDKIHIETKGNELHHWSYNKEHWLSVIEMPVSEHALLHRFIVYDQPAMFYKRKDTGELLDTKEKHFNYFIEIKNKHSN